MQQPIGNVRSTPKVMRVLASTKPPTLENMKKKDMSLHESQTSALYPLARLRLPSLKDTDEEKILQLLLTGEMPREEMWEPEAKGKASDDEDEDKDEDD
jgi:hypothetical protein